MRARLPGLHPRRLERGRRRPAGGLGPLGGKVFRIGTMGYGSTAENVQLLLSTLAEALKEEGYKA